MNLFPLNRLLFPFNRLLSPLHFNTGSFLLSKKAKNTGRSFCPNIQSSGDVPLCPKTPKREWWPFPSFPRFTFLIPRDGPPKTGTFFVLLDGPSSRAPFLIPMDGPPSTGMVLLSEDPTLGRSFCPKNPPCGVDPLCPNIPESAKPGDNFSCLSTRGTVLNPRDGP